MFKQIPETFIEFSKQHLVHLYQSLNQPHISPGAGLVAQPATAHLLVFQTSPAEIVIFIGLFFPESQQRVIYRMDAFSPEFLAENLAQAEAFVGEMGFMMDNLRLSSATEAERIETIRLVPFFYQDIELFFKALSTSEIQIRKAKVETAVYREQQADQQRVLLENYVRLLGML